MEKSEKSQKPRSAPSSRRRGLRSREKIEIGSPEYINENCWMAKTLYYPPSKRCQYCELKFHNCLFLQYLIISLILVFFLLTLSFLIEEKISRPVVISIFVLIIAYGYFFNKSTEKIIRANFAQRKAKEELGEAKDSLEIRIKARTKQLEEVAKGLDVQVKEKTKEIQKRLDELERFQKVTVGREIKMIELKKEIEEAKEILRISQNKKN